MTRKRESLAYCRIWILSLAMTCLVRRAALGPLYNRILTPMILSLKYRYVIRNVPTPLLKSVLLMSRIRLRLFLHCLKVPQNRIVVDRRSRPLLNRRCRKERKFGMGAFTKIILTTFRKPRITPLNTLIIHGRAGSCRRTTQVSYALNVGSYAQDGSLTTTIPLARKRPWTLLVRRNRLRTRRRNTLKSRLVRIRVLPPL